ncbi:hypothetical protein Pmani_014623 [Petrolisthes manimaculis]|uniref:Uncharacterized protein n=1 Tax=Petrolisthes manimaculis TaxID=1843537 RepID=A0AAE1UCF0_9EUCA|nr:hypothetical protein Pmani_014623 [Petrolisthes manimaculis]
MLRDIKLANKHVPNNKIFTRVEEGGVPFTKPYHIITTVEEGRVRSPSHADTYHNHHSGGREGPLTKPYRHIPQSPQWKKGGSAHQAMLSPTKPCRHIPNNHHSRGSEGPLAKLCRP